MARSSRGVTEGGREQGLEVLEEKRQTVVEDVSTGKLILRVIGAKRPPTSPVALCSQGDEADPYTALVERPQSGKF